MHGGEKGVDDLLEVVVQSRLPLTGIGADTILDEIKQHIHAIQISLGESSPL